MSSENNNQQKTRTDFKAQNGVPIAATPGIPIVLDPLSSFNFDGTVISVLAHSEQLINSGNSLIKSGHYIPQELFDGIDGVLADIEILLAATSEQTKQHQHTLHHASHACSETVSIMMNAIDAGLTVKQREKGLTWQETFNILAAAEKAYSIWPEDLRLFKSIQPWWGQKSIDHIRQELTTKTFQTGPQLFNKISLAELEKRIPAVKPKPPANVGKDAKINPEERGRQLCLCFAYDHQLARISHLKKIQPGYVEPFSQPSPFPDHHPLDPTAIGKKDIHSELLQEKEQLTQLKCHLTDLIDPQTRAMKLGQLSPINGGSPGFQRADATMSSSSSPSKLDPYNSGKLPHGHHFAQNGKLPSPTKPLNASAPSFVPSAGTETFVGWAAKPNIPN